MGIYDYLDRKLATKRILRDWNDLAYARDHNREKIEYIRTKLTKTTQSVGSSPVKGGGSSKEAQLVNGLDAIERLEKEIYSAEETLSELEQCWVHLTEEEKLCLLEMYVDNEDRQGYKRLMDALCVEKSEAFRRANNALERLAFLLFW